MGVSQGCVQTVMCQTEKAFQSAVRDYARLRGWRCYCVWDSRNSPKGWPDLVLLRPPRLVVAELKSTRGRLTKEQRETLNMLVACGVESYAWWPESWSIIEKTLE